MEAMGSNKTNKIEIGFLISKSSTVKDTNFVFLSFHLRLKFMSSHT